MHMHDVDLIKADIDLIENPVSLLPFEDLDPGQLIRNKVYIIVEEIVPI